MQYTFHTAGHNKVGRWMGGAGGGARERPQTPQALGGGRETPPTGTCWVLAQQLVVPGEGSANSDISTGHGTCQGDSTSYTEQRGSRARPASRVELTALLWCRPLSGSSSSPCAGDFTENWFRTQVQGSQEMVRAKDSCCSPSSHWVGKPQPGRLPLALGWPWVLPTALLGPGL